MRKLASGRWGLSIVNSILKFKPADWPVPGFLQLLLLFLLALAARTPAGQTDGENPPSQTVTNESGCKSAFIVANGIKLHYLDWGGSGDPVLLLAAFGETAHVFDEFAPAFTNRFRVVALTRRGFGESEQTKAGYDLQTRVEDVHQFLAGLRLLPAHLVGHSIAGDEMTLFAQKYPQSVKSLIYLDAAYDRSKLLALELEAPAPPLFKRLLAEALELPGARDINVPDLPPPDAWEALKATLKASATYSPDYGRVGVRTLALFATSSRLESSPDLDPELRAKMEKWIEKTQPIQRSQIEQFRKQIRDGQVIELKNATHYLFRGATRDQVIRHTIEFLRGATSTRFRND